MLVSQLVHEVAQEVHDAAYVRWSQDLLMAYINQGVAKVCSDRPDAYTEVQAVELVPNSPIQPYPATAGRIMALTRNMGADGTTPGSAIRLVDYTTLTARLPGWQSETGDEVYNYMSEPFMGRNYYVYPAVEDTHFVEGVFTVEPPVVGLEDHIPIDSLFSHAVKCWAQHLVWRSELDDPASTVKAQTMETAYYQIMGVQTQAAAVTPAR
jgi:hypothetical protein